LKNLIFASILGLVSVAMGAFGAHALKDILEPEALQSYETGVRYMMIHALTLLFLNNSTALEQKTKNTLSYLFMIGIVFFSGSIFAIQLKLADASSIWFITPLGGMFLISGWLGMVVAFFKKKRAS
jgi:uncharacterized membrane protein YgdD (TMEM256/DUF423 family)